MNSADIFPTLLGIALVAAAAAFALLPFAGARADDAVAESEPAVTDRFAIYRQILELEFDAQLGKLSREDFELLSAELLAQASEALHAERGTIGEVDEEIEREIAAARSAFAAARQTKKRVRNAARTR